MGELICAWCKKPLGKCNVNGISHGIYERCKKKFLEDLEKIE